VVNYVLRRERGVKAGNGRNCPRWRSGGWGVETGICVKAPRHARPVSQPDPLYLVLREPILRAVVELGGARSAASK
jgi:hypothetical protein